MNKFGKKAIEIKDGDRLGIYVIKRELGIDERSDRCYRQVVVVCPDGVEHTRRLTEVCRSGVDKCWICFREESLERIESFLDLVVGKTYGCWTAREFVEPKQMPGVLRNPRLFVCECTCGEVQEIRLGRLLDDKRRPRCQLSPITNNKKKVLRREVFGRISPEDRAVMYVNRHKD